MSNALETQFVVAFRAQAAPVFKPGSYLRVNVPVDVGTLVLTFQTRYLDKGLEDRLPGDLWIDARGPAKSLEIAVSLFGDAADSILSVVAFCTNAAIGDMAPEIAFDNSPNIPNRRFLQVFMPEERALIRVGRAVNVDSVKALMQSIEGHAESDRVGRAMTQYRLALRHWRVGHETMSTAHLYMGMETLTKATLRSKYLIEGKTEQDVAKEFGIDPESLDPCKRISSEVEAKVRRDVLFQGDNETHRDAKAASDGLEHGFMPFDEIRARAQRVRNASAKYLREAILDLLDVKQDNRSQMLSEPFDIPLGNWPLVKYLKGTLNGESDRLASPDNEYPIMSWRSRIKSAKLSDNGEYQMEFDENFTASLAEGIEFQAQSFEVWKP